MNFRFVINQLGLLLIVLSAILGGVALWEIYEYWQGAHLELVSMEAMIASAGVGLCAGGGMWYLGRGAATKIGRREALLLVALSWLVGAALSGLPYFLWAVIHHSTAPTPIVETGGPAHPFLNYVDCYFEAMSGLTTTGATVLSEIESLPRGLLLWRAITHWLGGLGIVVLFVAVLPTVGAGGKKLFLIEAPGPTPTGVKPRIKDTARILWFIYVGLTIAQTVALRLCGMSWFDALCHTMATLATGGFSTRNASVGDYNLASVIVIIFFMVLAGANFGLYYQIIRGSWRNVLADTEMRAYLLLLTAGSLIVVASLVAAQQPLPLTTGDQHEPSIARALEQGVFTTVSIQTTTGFCTGDFNTWPFLAQATLIGLMFIGGCAGSTAGGIKVVRIWVAIKIIYTELERVFNPNVVRPTRLGGSGSIKDDLKLSVMIYCFGIILLFAIGAVAIKVIEGDACDFTTAATASVATLCTIGPGLSQIGAIENYGWMTSSSKVVLSLWMALGRLEVFAILVLLLPRFWRTE
ncbi:TrkH family potassium uptake protein [Planctomycetales bacterium ZRK34]|nr:TrkH family potassium uptake protein [Planctomycetales bacterium ZRK34]